jgi:hypothetical protein
MAHLIVRCCFAGTLLCACAGAPEASHSAVPVTHEPDCSFRSASTCWTLGSRLPPRRASRNPERPRTLEAPASFATTPDTVRSP